MQQLLLYPKAPLIWRIAQVFGTGAASYAALQGLLPAPACSFRAEVRGEILDQNPPKDPKGEIKFENVGWGPMYLHKFSWQVDGQEVPDLKSVLGSEGDRWIITSESVLGTGGGKPWGKGDQSLGPILTVRPKEPFLGSQDWANDFKELLKERQVTSVVEYAYFQAWPLSWRQRDVQKVVA